MKSIVVLLSVDGEIVSAVIRTNDDGNCQNITIMEVDIPEGVSENAFPFKRGTVCNYSDIYETLAMQGAKGELDIVEVHKEDANESELVDVQLIYAVEITVTNEGATLTINGEVQPGLSWLGYLHNGESVTYSAELEGYTTQTDTIVVDEDDVIKTITLQQND